MTDRQIAAQFIRKAQRIKREQGVKAYNRYEARVRRAVFTPAHVRRAETSE